MPFAWWQEQQERSTAARTGCIFASLCMVADGSVRRPRVAGPCSGFGLALAVDFVGYGQFFAPLGTACGEYAATVGSLHTMAETVLVVSFPVVRLECSFHCDYAVFYISVGISWAFGKFAQPLF